MQDKEDHQNLSDEERQTLCSLGKNYFCQGQYEKAKVVFKGLLAFFPNDQPLKQALVHLEKTINKISEN